MMRSPSPLRISQQANRSNVEIAPSPATCVLSVEARGYFSFSSGCRLRAVPAVAPPGPCPHENQGTVKLITLVKFSLNLEEH